MMVADKLIEIAIMEGIALVFLVFAYQIGVKGRLSLIAGYNERTADRVKDKEGLKRLVTRLCVLLGFGSAIMPLMTHLASGTANGLAYVLGGYGGFVIGVVGIVMLQARDYTAHP